MMETGGVGLDFLNELATLQGFGQQGNWPQQTEANLQPIYATNTGRHNQKPVLKTS